VRECIWWGVCQDEYVALGRTKIVTVDLRAGTQPTYELLLQSDKRIEVS
jgi:hypothetical protein